MEERALYAAVLAAPHDNTPRLVYADWLDENADRFPRPRGERARAEFIRLQCEQAGLSPAGWRREAWPPAPTAREKRLLFTQGRKWRRAYPAWIASGPFDRGFLRPYRALRPDQFLRARRSGLGEQPFFGPLPPDHPARRFLGEDGCFSLCPLWDVHLFAPDLAGDMVWSDHGQYGELLAAVGDDPALERVGWLMLSFFRTPTAEFLRTGNFANVESLVLNCGPFPEVLEAVAENESFRSLRYLWFGPDRWAWVGTDARLTHFMQIALKLHEANGRNLAHGEMRSALRAILSDVAATPAPPPPPAPMTISFPPQLAGAQAGARDSAGPESTGGGLVVFVVGGLVLMRALLTVSTAPNDEFRGRHPNVPITNLKLPWPSSPGPKPLTPEEFWGIKGRFPARPHLPQPDLTNQRGSRSLPVAPPPRPVPDKEPPPEE